MGVLFSLFFIFKFVRGYWPHRNVQKLNSRAIVRENYHALNTVQDIVNVRKNKSKKTPRFLKKEIKAEDLSKKNILKVDGLYGCSRRELFQIGLLFPLLLMDPEEAASQTVEQAQTNKTQQSVRQIISKAGAKAFGGGLSGASAAVLQVLSLMWLRTTMNYEYRYGTSTLEAMNKLYQEGGVARFYQGLPFALIQGPLSRFGDVASNAGVFSLLEAFSATENLPIAVKTALASGAASVWRIFIMPVDTYKTTLQVEGVKGISQLKTKIEQKSFTVLYEGALATCAASFVGNFPWFITYNTLASSLPLTDPDDVLLTIVRNAALGMSASCVSDCCSNSLRVVKTTKQTSKVQISYLQALQEVVNKDGVSGLFGRGLKTRLLTNMLQGALFSVAWKYFEGFFHS